MTLPTTPKSLLKKQIISIASPEQQEQQQQQQQNEVTILNLSEALSLTSSSSSPSPRTSTRRSSGGAVVDELNHKSSMHSCSTSGSSVSFSHTLVQSVQPTICRSDYTLSERKATWYDSLEYRSLKRERKEIVKYMESQHQQRQQQQQQQSNNNNPFTMSSLYGSRSSGSSDEEAQPQPQQGQDQDPVDEQECTRGLECKTREGNRRRTNAVLNAVCAVLDVQEEQEVSFSVDPEAVADLYRMFTRESQQQALERARKDAEEARMLLLLSASTSTSSSLEVATPSS